MEYKDYYATLGVPKTVLRCIQTMASRWTRMSMVARPVEACTAQQMMDLPGLLRNGTWWPMLEMDVCKPDCE